MVKNDKNSLDSRFIAFCGFFTSKATYLDELQSSNLNNISTLNDEVQPEIYEEFHGFLEDVEVDDLLKETEEFEIFRNSAINLFSSLYIAGI